MIAISFIKTFIFA